MKTTTTIVIMTEDSFTKKHLAKGKGVRHDPIMRNWYLASESIAQRLYKQMTPVARLTRNRCEHEELEYRTHCAVLGHPTNSVVAMSHQRR